MKNLGIRTKITLLALLPALLLSIIFAIFFTIYRFNELNNNFEQIKDSVMTQLAPTSKCGLLSHNIPLLQALIYSATENPHIIAVSVYNQSGKLLVYAGPNHLMPKKLDTRQTSLKNNNNDYFRYTVPLIIQESDFFPLKAAKIPYPILPVGTVLGWISVEITTETFFLKKIFSLLFASLFIIIGLLLALISIRLFGKEIIISVNKILAWVSNLKQAKYDFIAKDIYGKEFIALSDGLNQLSSKIKNLQEEFQHHVELTTADIRQNLEAIEIQNIELDLACKKAQLISQKKSEFIADLNHEVRTPISSLVSFVNLLLDTELAPFQKDYLITIKKLANTLLAIINDILDLSKIEAGKFKLENISLDIGDCIEEVLSSLAPTAQEQDIELIALIDPKILLRVLGDPLRFKQIITNLVSNSIKFTEHGSVVVKAELLKDSNNTQNIQIQVVDTGIGLSKEQQQRLFHAFTQADNFIAHKFGGTGLGLVISKKLIEQMGGAISLESKSGEGTTITFNIKVNKIESNLNQSLQRIKIFDALIVIYDQNPMTQKALLNMLTNKASQLYLATKVEDIIPLFNTHVMQHKILIAGINKKINSDFAAVLETVKKNHCQILALINGRETDILHYKLQIDVDICFSKPVSHKKLYQCLNTLLLNESPQTSKSTDSINNVNVINTEDIHILIAEDNPINMKLLCLLLESLKTKIVTAFNGAEAIVCANQQKFDLILADLQMPKIDGFETASKIRSECSLNSRTPIIAISAFISDDDQKLLYASGFNDYLIKPIDKIQLTEMIHTWLQRTDNHSPQHHHDSSENILDLDKLIQLSGGQPKLALEILALFIDDLPRSLHEIRQAYASQDYAYLSDLIHQLHGASSYCCVSVLKSTISTFEKSLKNNETFSYAELMQRLEIDIANVLSFVAEHKIL